MVAIMSGYLSKDPETSNQLGILRYLILEEYEKPFSGEHRKYTIYLSFQDTISFLIHSIFGSGIASTSS